MVVRAPAYAAIQGRDCDEAIQGRDRGAPLPSGDVFFAPGRERTAWESGVACVGDASRFLCAPEPWCCPARNAFCWCMYNFCAGASARDGFLWPFWCPCGLCTCCVPPKVVDVACCCCRTPEERCASGRYVAQRVLLSGMDRIPALYPFPPAASEREAYGGRGGPQGSKRVIPRRFNMSVLEATPERKAWHALRSPRER